MSVPLRKNNEELQIKDVLVQPNSLLMVQDTSIGVFKLTSNALAPANQSCEMDAPIENVGFDINSANIIVASSGPLLTVFEARGKGVSFQCKNRGTITLPDSINSLTFHSSNHLLYIAFDSSVGILKYDPKHVGSSILLASLEQYSIHE